MLDGEKRDHSSAGLGGKGGGGPGVFGSKPPVKGVNGATSSPWFVDDLRASDTVVGSGSSSTEGTVFVVTNRETRASSSCVSWMYSAGGRGISGGGAGGVVAEEMDEDGELSPFV